ncbi:MAG: gamma-glutamyl-gamma-aminobutyrate hydrolase family protein [Candidatus Aenigmarchaeota archaeon]|nr:gamma-glutamyl-gamma-aminobutyrate hydrolase family protein [Candidatus Aenigmarchaeota archaeon]
MFYILEFGGQHTDLIGNRLRDMGFDVRYAESDARIPELRDASGIIISGGPKSVSNGYPHDPALFSSRVPVLGICYGMQLLGKHLGAGIHRRTREYGETRMSILDDSDLFHGLGSDGIVWMNHGDSVTHDGDFTTLAMTEKGVPAAMRSGNLYGVQFHPEVTHTENGREILRNFAERVCGQEPGEMKEEGFDAGAFIDEAVRCLREEAGDRTALILTSGGVDSTVAAKLAQMAGVRRQHAYLESGNGRKGEAAYVSGTIGHLLDAEIYIHVRRQMFLDALYGIHEPEQKRKLFADLYASARHDMERLFEEDEYVLVQGTIATDRRESGKEAGKGRSRDSGTAAIIKTHHNTRAEDTWRGATVSPLAELTKDMVRMVARKLGLPGELSERQPFPGPGMFIRYATGFHSYGRGLEDSASDIAASYGLEGHVLPRKGVGLKGDDRAFEHAALLAGGRDWDNVRAASKSIIEDTDVCRVLYLPHEMRFKPGHFMESGDYPMTERTLERLREVTDVVESTMRDHDVQSSQTPVITFGGPDGWINVIRDVQSEDFRTLRPLRKPGEFPWECYDEIDRRLRERLGGEAGMTTFDVSDKPGGTTEWE